MKYRARLTWDARVLEETSCEVEVEIGQSIHAELPLGAIVKRFAESNRHFSEEFGVPLNDAGPFFEVTRLGVYLEPVEEE